MQRKMQMRKIQTESASGVYSRMQLLSCRPAVATQNALRQEFWMWSQQTIPAHILAKQCSAARQIQRFHRKYWNRRRAEPHPSTSSLVPDGRVERTDSSNHAEVVPLNDAKDLRLNYHTLGRRVIAGAPNLYVICLFQLPRLLEYSSADVRSYLECGNKGISKLCSNYRSMLEEESAAKSAFGFLDGRDLKILRAVSMKHCFFDE